MKRLVTLVCVFCLALLMAQGAQAQQKLHDFVVKSIDGKDFSLSSLKGKKVLVVNVASRCGLTPQYAQLQQLYETYREHGLVIVAFPANNFLGQEPGTNDEIAAFCSSNYAVTFPLMAKVSVKDHDMAPVYHWLTEKELNGKEDAPVLWNFQKYMIDEEGRWVGVLAPNDKAFVAKISEWVEAK